MIKSNNLKRHNSSKCVLGMYEILKNDNKTRNYASGTFYHLTFRKMLKKKSMEKVNLHEKCKEIYNLTLQFLTEYCGKKAKKTNKKQTNFK